MSSSLNSLSHALYNLEPHSHPVAEAGGSRILLFVETAGAWPNLAYDVPLSPPPRHHDLVLTPKRI